MSEDMLQAQTSRGDVACSGYRPRPGWALPKPFFARLKNRNSSSFRIGDVMADIEEMTRLHICLDKQSYVILKQKASYNKMAMKRYLKLLAKETRMIKHEVCVHDLTAVNRRLDELTLKAGEHYDMVLHHDKDYRDAAEYDSVKILEDAKELTRCLIEFFQALSEKREQALGEEADKIERAISIAGQSSPRDPEAAVLDPKYYDVDIVLSKTEKELIFQNMHQSGWADASAYMRELITSKRFIYLFWSMEDLNNMVESTYIMVRYLRSFIAILKPQEGSYSELVKELEMNISIAEQKQEDIWDLVEADRKKLYIKYLPGISEVREKWQFMKRDKSAKEMDIWLSQE